MKVVEIKRLKFVFFLFVILALLIIIFKYKKTHIAQSFGGFNSIRGNKYILHENNLLADSGRGNGNNHLFHEEGSNGRHAGGVVLEEYNFSEEDMEKKFQENLHVDKDDDVVEFIPPQGKKYRKIGKQNFKEFFITTLGPSDFNHAQKIDFEEDASENNYGDRDVIKDPGVVDPLPGKDNFAKDSVKAYDRKYVHGARPPVYKIPRKKTNVLLDEKNRNMLKEKQDGIQNQNENVKDYEMVDGDSEEMEDVEEYSLVHNFLASRITSTPQTQANLPASVPKHHYIFSSYSLPDKLNQRPTFGNGFVGGVVRGEDVHVSGLYMGKYEHSHRASVPATSFHNLSISDGKNILLFKKTHNLDVSRGIYSEVWTHPSHHLVQRVYAHRTLRNLVVYEVDYKRGLNSADSTVIKVELNKWRESSDFTFSIHDSFDDEVSYKVGRVNGHETPETLTPLIHVLYDHVPTELKPSQFFRRTKWVFLTAYAHSEEEVRQAYEEGKRMIVGRDDLIREHIEGWAVLWRRGRVDVTGMANDASTSDTASHLARAIYSSLYYTFSSLPLKFNESFTGLSESGLPFGNFLYPQGSRVKVSQELFIFPPLLLLHNSFAKFLLKSRKQTSDGAFINANYLQRRGMVYAFESGSSGVELSRDRARGDLSPFVSASVSHAIRQYLYSTDDIAFVNKTFSPLIFNIAEYLHSRLQPATDAYHINNQIALDESHGNISDSPFSNYIIKEALCLPLELNNRIVTPRIDQFLLSETWSKIAKKIYLPSLEKNLVPAFKNYNFADRVDEADVVMLSFPLNVNMSNEMNVANIDFYEQMSQSTSSMETKAMYLINWLALGRTSRASAILASFLSLNNNNFRTWSPSSKDFKKQPNHLPSMGAFMQVILHGYLGSRLRKDRLDINPSLPLNISSLHVVGVDYMKQSFNVHIEESSVSIMVTRRHQNSPTLVAHVYSDERRHELKLNKQIILPRTKVAIIQKSVAESLKEKLT